MSETAKPRPAATVILLRPSAPTGFEIFLTQRPHGMPFLGGMYCFPGGGVLKDDFSPRMISRCSGVSPEQARTIVGAQFRPPEALGFWIAAIRELFEEAGILLAVNASRAAISVNRTKRERLAVDHASLIAKSLSFRALLESDNLYCHASALRYFSRWQTPAENPMRFDTRFFLAVLPRGQTPSPNSHEVIHSLWLSPDRAIQLCERGELPLIFPTFASLRTLADFETMESLFEEFGNASALRPTQPGSAS